MKILVVEDNEDSRNLLMKQLLAYGHDVTAAANGAEALPQALAQPPDIIVSDIMMPKMDGYQLCHEWKQNDKLKDIPFVFYTATYTREEDEKFALSLGANAFIRKPAEPEAFIQILIEIFEKAKAGALAPPEVTPLEPSLYLTEYNKRLIAKLDKKVAQLEESEGKLKYIDSVLRAIRNINQLIVRERNRAKVLNGTCEILIKVREYKFAWIGLIEEGHKRVLPMAKAGFEKGYLDSVKITWDDTATGKGPTGTAIKTRQPSLMRNIPEDPRFEPWRAEALKRGYLSSAAVPLVHDGKVYGALSVYSSQRDGFDDEETGLLVEVSSDLAFALKAINDEEERKRAEEALADEATRRRILVEQSRDGIVVLDQNGNVYEANQQFAEMLGYSSEEILQINVCDWEFQFTPEQVLDMIRTVDETGDHFETQHRRKDGTIYDVEISTNAAIFAGQKLIFCVCRDITERKQAEEEIRKFKVIADQAPYGVTISCPEGELIYVNNTYAGMHGYTPEELIGQHISILYTEEQLKEIKKLRSQLLQVGRFVAEEVWHKKKDGTVFPTLMSAHLVKDDVGNPLFLTASVLDITEQKKMEEQLIVTDRLASIGELSSGIAHELNNPLTSVIGFSDLLLGKKDLPDDVKEDLRVVNREAKRTAQVVRNLLTFARKHEAKKKAVDIHGIIKLVLELRAYEQKLKNIKVHTRFASSLPEIIADGFQLQQVFLNIIINAEHFMAKEHGRGTLTITTERAGDIIRASFADDGPGIAKRNLGHLFDPFFTTKEVGKGTGLGLSISYGIITEHGGRIYVESELGKGATFIVEFPISQ